MPTYDKIITDNAYRQIADSSAWPAGIATPKNLPRESDGGGIDLHLWNDKSGLGSAPSSLADVRMSGWELSVGEQLQLGSGGGTTIDLNSYYASAQQHQAPTPTTNLAAKPEPVCAFDASGDVVAMGYVMSSYAQPNVGADVTLDLDDSTPFSGYSTGQELYTSSGVYTLQAGSTFAAPGTLVARWTGVGASRLATID